jgi:uncharacterized protein (TIGR03083 family)
MRIDHIAAIEEQNAAFTDAVTRPDALQRPVSACPGWTVHDLVSHLGEVQSFWALVLPASGALPDEEQARAAADPGGDLIGWWRQRSAGLVRQLRELPADAPSWCWWNDDERTTVGDVAFRQAHEAVIHRWDAEHAVDSVRPTDPALAADGVDEFATRFLRGGEWTGPSGLLALRATDTGLEWRFGCGTESPSEDGHPRWLANGPARTAATVVSGSAERLDLMLWRRVQPEPGQVEGDADLLAAFLAWPGLD